jgi:RelE toxin of RelE / RelB toxin-antitoxin system
MAYIPRVPTPPIAVVELPLFQRLAADLWDDAEREAFVDFIARNPEAGDVIPETGGVRKLRWRRQGMGKRGGARVIYFYHDAQMPLFLLLVYAKAQREDMTPEQKKQVRALAASLRRSYGRKG